MQRFGLWLGLLVASASPLFAQVSVEVTLDQDQFLPGESLVAVVRITNRSGQTLHLGGEEDWLSFSVESPERSVVSKTGDVPVVGKFDLGSSQKATKRVELASYYALSQQGRYTITATLRIKQWGQEITSRAKEFGIIEGTKLWEQEVGVPQGAETAKGTPEVRKYILQQANYVKKELRLYLRVTDESGTRIIRTLPIGPLLSFSRPEAQVDKHSNLHVLYQSGPQAFSYTVFNTDGELIVRQTHDYVQTRPRLQTGANEEISVHGGVRRMTANDKPAPQANSAADETERPKP